MILINLFLSFLQIGAFSFGGGYAAMPLIQNQVVDIFHWLSIGEFTDLVTISQMTPGPIAINAATFVGLKVNGLPGALISTLGCILPSCIIVTTIAYFYLKYRNLSVLQNILKTLRPAVVAMIATAGLSIIITAIFKDNIIDIDMIKINNVIIFLVSLVLLLKTKTNPIWVMLLAGVMNVGLYFVL